MHGKKINPFAILSAGKVLAVSGKVRDICDGVLYIRPNRIVIEKVK